MWPMPFRYDTQNDWGVFGSEDRVTGCSLEVRDVTTLTCEDQDVNVNMVRRTLGLCPIKVLKG